MPLALYKVEFKNVAFQLYWEGVGITAIEVPKQRYLT